MSDPRIVAGWPSGSAGKVSTLYFGYEQGVHDSKSYWSMMGRLLYLVQEKEVELLYLDHTLVERKIVVFRFTSTQAYETHRDGLVKLAEGLARGVWEPNRDTTQWSKWLREMPEATPTIAY